MKEEPLSDTESVSTNSTHTTLDDDFNNVWLHESNVTPPNLCSEADPKSIPFFSFLIENPSTSHCHTVSFVLRLGCLRLRALVPANCLASSLLHGLPLVLYTTWSL